MVAIRGRKLFIGPHDLLDGTPILDIKPYIPEVDSYPGERQGWLDQVKEEPEFELVFTPRAAAQLAWLGQHYHRDFPERVTRILRCDPYPHKTRRITKLPNELRLGCGAWRVFFTIEREKVRIRCIDSGLYEPTTNAEAPLHFRFRDQPWEQYDGTEFEGA